MVEQPQSLRSVIDFIESLECQDLLEANDTPWGISKTPLFDETLRANIRTFPDLDAKLLKFLEFKLPAPFQNRYGKHDSSFSGPLTGFFHAHLRDDAILIYNLSNRCINLVAIVTHAEIEGKRASMTAKRLQPYNLQGDGRTQARPRR